MKFFFDNNLAARIAHGLHQMVEPEHRVFHLRDKFAPNIEDAEWMKALALEADWIIITADVRIGRNPHEVKAWKEAGHNLLSEAGMDGPHLLGSSQQIHQMFPANPC